jgi:hypothetical protein
MRIDLWQHGLGGMCLLDELLMLLVQYGYDANSSPSVGGTRAEGGGDQGGGRQKASWRNSMGAARSEAVAQASSERRPEASLTRPFEHQNLSYQQQLQQQQQEDSLMSSELPPGSLLKEQSVLIQNHVLGLCKRFKKWLDDLDECLQEALECAISGTADRMRVGMIERFRLFVKKFHKEVTRLDKHRALPPAGRYTPEHLARVRRLHSSQRRISRAWQRKHLQVSACISLSFLVFPRLLALSFLCGA